MNEHADMIGLVLCGGESSRMKTDKSRLKYYQVEQRYHAYLLLRCLGLKTYISCSEEQASTIERDYPHITDNPFFSNHGPLSGVLSAFQENRGKSIFVIGCDYPLLRLDDLTKLFNKRREGYNAICYRRPKNKNPEPLIAIYEYTCHDLLLRFFQSGNYSLSDFLKSVKTHMILPDSITSIKSVDDEESFRSILRKIKN